MKTHNIAFCLFHFLQITKSVKKNFPNTSTQGRSWPVCYPWHTSCPAVPSTTPSSDSEVIPGAWEHHRNYLQNTPSDLPKNDWGGGGQKRTHLPPSAIIRRAVVHHLEPSFLQSSWPGSEWKWQHWEWLCWGIQERTCPPPQSFSVPLRAA